MIFRDFDARVAGSMGPEPNQIGEISATDSGGSAAHISVTVRVVTGCRQWGATSRSGTKTKARSAIRGCGRIKDGGVCTRASSKARPRQCDSVRESGQTRSPSANKSRSRTRASQRWVRVRPNACSTSCNRDKSSSGPPVHWMAAAAFTKSGPDPAGMAGVRYNLEWLTESDVTSFKAASAARSVSSASPKGPGRFAPNATSAFVTVM